MPEKMIGVDEWNHQRSKRSLAEKVLGFRPPGGREGSHQIAGVIPFLEEALIASTQNT
jgi:hypothetical protein